MVPPIAGCRKTWRGSGWGDSARPKEMHPGTPEAGADGHLKGGKGKAAGLCELCFRVALRSHQGYEAREKKDIRFGGEDIIRDFREIKIVSP